MKLNRKNIAVSVLVCTLLFSALAILLTVGWIMSNMVYANFRVGIYEIVTLTSLVGALTGYLFLALNTVVQLIRHNWSALYFIEKVNLGVTLLMIPLFNRGFSILKMLIINGNYA